MLGGVDELAILDVSKNVNSMEIDILHWAKQNHYLKKDVSTSAKKLITPKKDISENSSTISNIIIDLDTLLALKGHAQNMKVKIYVLILIIQKRKG